MVPIHSGCVLDSSVLVLNRYFSPIHVVNVRRAITLLYCDSAEVVVKESGRYAAYDFSSWRLLGDLLRSDSAFELVANDHEWICAVGGDIRAPRVIRLLDFSGAQRSMLRFSRRSLFARDDHCCQYCGERFTPDNLSFDHVIPRSRGGQTDWENVVCSCLDCNSRKGGRTPQEARMRLLRRPTRPKNNPILAQKLAHPRYEIWRAFLPDYASTEANT